MNTNINDIELKDLLEYMGEKVVRHGRYHYRLRDHDSLIMKGSLFVWNSKNIKGNFYTLLKSMYGLESREIYKIVKKFLGDIQKGIYKTSENIEINHETVKDYRISKKKEDYKKLEEYLVNKRKISPKIVKALYTNKIIFLDEVNNINFVIKDLNRREKGYDLVGTGELRFKRNTSEEHGFNIEDNPDLKKETIYVFEAPIDLISYIEMNKEKISKKHKKEGVRFLSLSGVREDILENYINEDIKNIYVCVDNDDSGDKFYKLIKEKYSNLNIYRELPKLKDWNEDLQNKKKLEKKRKYFQSRKNSKELEK